MLLTIMVIISVILTTTIVFACTPSNNDRSSMRASNYSEKRNSFGRVNESVEKVLSRKTTTATTTKTESVSSPVSKRMFPEKTAMSRKSLQLQRTQRMPLTEKTRLMESTQKESVAGSNPSDGGDGTMLDAPSIQINASAESCTNIETARSKRSQRFHLAISPVPVLYHTEIDEGKNMLLTILMTLMIILTIIICKPVDNRARQAGKKNRESVTTTLGKPRCAGSEFPQAAVLPPTPVVTIKSERTGVERTKEMKSRPEKIEKSRRSKELVEPTQKSDSFASPSSCEEADGTSQDAPSIPIREDGRSYETEMDTAKSPFVVDDKFQRKKNKN